MKNKIILGSANFNQIYGVKRNFIRKNEIRKLFNIAFKNNIKTIDTSPLYNNSERIIGSLNNNRFRIISKIPPIPKNKSAFVSGFFRIKVKALAVVKKTHKPERLKNIRNLKKDFLASANRLSSPTLKTRISKNKPRRNAQMRTITAIILDSSEIELLSLAIYTAKATMTKYANVPVIS